MSELKLDTVTQTRQPSVTDLVFQQLYQRVIELDLPPGTRLSEAEVSKQMDVSRQPVRDAFFRLSQLGFLQIRPQRATIVTPISATAVRRARFIRTALELETVRMAVNRLTDEDLIALNAFIGEQEGAMKAGDRVGFHRLDDDFHKELCRRSGVEFAWTMIRENKAHMDRVRFLSLSFGAQSALDDHVAILRALERRDEELALAAMRLHLSRIEGILGQIRSDFVEYFDSKEG